MYTYEKQYKNYLPNTHNIKIYMMQTPPCLFRAEQPSLYI